MTFSAPFWLLLAIPLVLTFWMSNQSRGGLRVLRILICLLLLLAVAGLSLRLPGRQGCVVVVADRSLSMPVNSSGMQEEVAHLIHDAMGSDDQLAVVAFGERSSVEQAPKNADFSGFVNDVGNEGSHLGEALDRAISILPKDTPGRILVLSDGYATGKQVSTAAARAAGAGIPIDYRAMQRSSAGDLAIERVDAPQSVAGDEAFLISAWIESPHAQRVSYTLKCESRLISQGELDVSTGRTRLLFRDHATEAGVRDYTLQVHTVGDGSDPLPENNQARFLVGIRGNKPVLCVSPVGSALPALLSGSGVKIDQKTSEQFSWSLGALAGYSGVIIENIPASNIGTAGMETLSAWVNDAGGGLLLTGGRNSYGAGGYYKSPLEPLLPVSMELRKEHRKLSLAIVVALDRSGSMAVPVDGGRTKMQLADVATAEVLNQLSAIDQFGCLAVDSSAHEIVPLSDVSEKEAIESRIMQIDSMGGGIFIYEALEKAAAMIAPATAGTKHIILFADAADSEEPGDYQDLLKKLTAAGVTVSVIGLGTEFDSDANLLKDIAGMGGGQCMFTTDANELPRLFAQDTFIVARSTFVEEPTPVRTTAGMAMLTSQAWGDVPQIGGYNLCYLRSGANLAAVTTDENQAPLVAGWQAGTGRVLTYTGEADGEYTGPIAGWAKAGEFYSSLARWITAQDQGLGSDLLLTQEVRDGVCLIKLHLDSERATTPFSTQPQAIVLRGRQGRKPDAERVALNWTSADSLSAEVPISGGETLLASLQIPGVGQTTLPPFCIPYSAEFAPRSQSEGLEALQQLAKATGGSERPNVTSIWHDIPRTLKQVPLAPWLLLTALGLVLLEVLQRRTGLLSTAGNWKLIRGKRGASTDVRPVGPQGSRRRAAAAIPAENAQAAPASAPSSKPTTPAPSQTPPAPPVEDPLAQARNRAARRTRR